MTTDKCNISFEWKDGKVGEKTCDTHNAKWLDTRPETCIIVE